MLNQDHEYEDEDDFGKLAWAVIKGDGINERAQALQLLVRVKLNDNHELENAHAVRLALCLAKFTRWPFVFLNIKPLNAQREQGRLVLRASIELLAQPQPWLTISYQNARFTPNGLLLVTMDSVGQTKSNLQNDGFVSASTRRPMEFSPTQSGQRSAS